jgi:hypothetical protein
MAREVDDVMRTNGAVPRVVGAMLLAVLLVACGGAAAPVPTSTPTAAPSPLKPGAHASKQFGAPVTWIVPAGWENPSDLEQYLLLRPIGSDLAGIHLFLDPFAASQDPSCPGEREPGVGTTADELADWIRSRPGLAVSPPTLATVGGLTGVMLDIRIADGWLPSCPFADGLPTVPLITRAPGGYHWVVAGNERLRIYLLDLPAGGTVLVDIDAFDGRLFNDLLREAAPVVNSLSFTGR